MKSMPFPPKFPTGPSPDDLIKKEIERRRIAKKHQKSIAQNTAKTNSPQLAPPQWLPTGLNWNLLTPPLQAALLDVVEPAYNQLVAQTSDHLARSAGLSLVGLLWQEVVNQYDQCQQFIADPFIRSLGNYPELFEKQLQLIDAKAKTSFIIVRIRENSTNTNAILPPSAPATPLVKPEIAQSPPMLTNP